MTVFETFALIVNGMTQVFGLGAFLFGVIDEERVWVRNQKDNVAIDVAPMFVNGEPVGAAVNARF